MLKAKKNLSKMKRKGKELSINKLNVFLEIRAYIEICYAHKIFHRNVIEFLFFSSIGVSL